jgi:hypothetical protein
MNAARKLASAFACVVILAGCGGGGGGGGSSTPAPVASPNSFTAQTAYKSWVTTGETDHFTVTGSCSGGASIVFDPAQAVMFEGVSGVGVGQHTMTTFSNCNGGATIQSDATNYYDTNGTLLGIVVLGQPTYVAFAAPPTALPANVKVGDTGTIGSFTIYQDSTKATVTGRRDLTWVIEADTMTTVLLNLTTKQYDKNGTLGLTEQDRLRLDGTGKATVVTIDQVYPGGVHLLYTKN